MSRRILFALGSGAVACASGAACTSLLGDLPGGTLLDAGAADVTTADGPGAPDGAAEAAPGGDSAAEAAAKDGAPQGDGGPGDGSSGDPVTQISAGGSSACAVTQSGALYCWGSNTSGTVGDGTTTPRASAVHITTDITGQTLGPVAQVSAGGRHVCARLRDNTVYCWGNDDAGQLGDGIFLPLADAGLADRHAPQKVPSVTATFVSSGFFHSCVPAAGNSYVCWGSNAYGEIGHTPGTMGDYAVSGGFYSWANSSPLGGVTVSDSTTASMGFFFSCANDTVLDDIFCWGANTNGQLGQLPDASAQYLPNPSAIPVGVNGGSLGASREVSTGWFHACATDGAGEAYCWGSPGAGQLGTSVTVAGGTYSQAVMVMNNVSHIAAGLYSTCVVDATQHVQCWGGNGQGQLGHDPSTDPLQMCPDNSQPCNPNPSTIKVGGTAFGPATGISIGLGYACALKGDGTVWCWGANLGGALGSGGQGVNDAGLAFEPVQVMGLPSPG
jgi:alpha-tubulin suppressor-like RCC1 family protein